MIESESDAALGLVVLLPVQVAPPGPGDGLSLLHVPEVDVATACGRQAVAAWVPGNRSYQSRVREPHEALSPFQVPDGEVAAGGDRQARQPRMVGQAEDRPRAPLQATDLLSGAEVVERDGPVL